MTTLPNRPHTALIVIDVQNGVVDGTPKRDDVVANINNLVGQARAQDVPVIWVQHNDDGLPRGSAEWELVPELVPRRFRAAGAQELRRFVRGHRA